MSGRTNVKHYDVAIIGGGASGCYLAALLADTDIRTALIESRDRLGRKLSATGNGQGNLTNVNVGADKYFCSDREWLADILCGVEDVLSPFCGLFETDDKGRVYPCGRQASSLTDALRTKIGKSNNIDVYLSSEVTDLSEGYVVTYSGGQLTADKVVLAAGGKAAKQFGTDGRAYSLAEKFGHKTTALYPALVQLRTDTTYTKTLKGLRVDCNATAEAGKTLRTCRGDVIFTDYGLSGNAIFTLSSFVTDKAGAVIRLEFLPDIPAHEIERDIRRKIGAGYERSEWLACTLPNVLGRAIMRRCASDDPREIARTVKDFRVECRGTLGFDYAQVTRGGIGIEGVSRNLESEYSRGLYFMGEILDVDGECGGYNLHWAFSCARRVFDAIYKRR